MTTSSTTSDNKARQRWLGVLARASRDELESAVATWDELPAVERVRPAEPGMFMLRGRIGGTGDAFNLGEATVTRCALRLGSGALGVGYALGRDRRKAELIALFDALLQSDEHFDRVQRDVIAPLGNSQTAKRDSASSQAATSRVEFFTMMRGEA